MFRDAAKYELRKNTFIFYSQLKSMITFKTWEEAIVTDCHGLERGYDWSLILRHFIFVCVFCEFRTRNQPILETSHIIHFHYYYLPDLTKQGDLVKIISKSSRTKLLLNTFQKNIFIDPLLSLLGLILLFPHPPQTKIHNKNYSWNPIFLL